MVTLKLARTADGFAAGDEHDRRLAHHRRDRQLRVQAHALGARGDHGRRRHRARRRSAADRAPDRRRAEAAARRARQRAAAAAGVAACRDGGAIPDARRRRAQARRPSARRPCARAASRWSGRRLRRVDLGEALRLARAARDHPRVQRGRADGRLGADPRRARRRGDRCSPRKSRSGRQGRPALEPDALAALGGSRRASPKGRARSYGPDALRSWRRATEVVIHAKAGIEDAGASPPWALLSRGRRLLLALLLLLAGASRGRRLPARRAGGAGDARPAAFADHDRGRHS